LGDLYEHHYQLHDYHYQVDEHHYWFALPWALPATTTRPSADLFRARIAAALRLPDSLAL